MSFSRWTFGGKSKRILDKIIPVASRIEALSKTYGDLSNNELKEIVNRNKGLIRSGSITLNDAMIEVYAAVIEASSRILNKRHFFEQILGGIVVHMGKIAELKTGEGKTLMSTLPIILNALTGFGVHSVTVNDYLAERDCKLNKPLYDFFGLTSGYIVNETESDEKREMYNRDIVYCTASRMAFDFLESHMVSDYSEKYRFSFKFLCMDEADYLAIDEARVPLIISSTSNADNEMYKKFNPIIAQLKLNEDFTVNQRGKTAWLSPNGFTKVENYTRDNAIIDGNLFSADNIDYFHIISNLLRAHYVMTKNKDYVVHDNQIYVIDEAIGRIAVGKKYSHGIHQAIEAKEGVPISKSTTISASITYPNFYRMYEKIGGMTGTGMTEAAEFEGVYKLDVVQIPTHRPIQRIDEPNVRLYKTKHDMFDDIAKVVYEANKKGQPILIGTESVMASETLSEILSNYRIKHSVLNAKNHKEEASIIAQAGKKYAVTISTNMAGRGVDIALGGNPEAAAQDLSENEYEDREQVLKVMKAKVAKERDEVMNLGGLLVIIAGVLNTKKDEQQLAGRAGRQGNPGRSIKYGSLEDANMADSNNTILSAFISLVSEVDEEVSLLSDGGRYVCNSSSTKIVEAVQQGKQESSYESRKHLLKFDNHIHKQRKLIYKLRDYILLTDKLVPLCISFANSLIEKLYAENLKNVSIFKKYFSSTVSDEFIASVNDKFNLNIKPGNYRFKDIQSAMIDRLYNIIIHKSEDDIRRHLIKTLDRCFRAVINKYEDLKRIIFIANYNQDDPYIKYSEIVYKMFVETITEIEMNVIKNFMSEKTRSEESLFNFGSLFEDNAIKEDFGSLFGGNATKENSKDDDNDLEAILSRLSGGKEGGIFKDLENLLKEREESTQDDESTEDDDIVAEDKPEEKNEFFDMFDNLAKNNLKQKSSESVEDRFKNTNKSLDDMMNSMFYNLAKNNLENKSSESENGFKGTNKSLDDMMNSIFKHSTKREDSQDSKQQEDSEDESLEDIIGSLMKQIKELDEEISTQEDDEFVKIKSQSKPQNLTTEIDSEESMNKEFDAKVSSKVNSSKGIPNVNQDNSQKQGNSNKKPQMARVDKVNNSKKSDASIAKAFHNKSTQSVAKNKQMKINDEVEVKNSHESAKVRKVINDNKLIKTNDVSTKNKPTKINDADNRSKPAHGANNNTKFIRGNNRSTKTNDVSNKNKPRSFDGINNKTQGNVSKTDNNSRKEKVKINEVKSVNDKSQSIKSDKISNKTQTVRLQEKSGAKKFRDQNTNKTQNIKSDNSSQKQKTFNNDKKNK